MHAHRMYHTVITIGLLDPMDVLTPLAMNRSTTCTKFMLPQLSACTEVLSRLSAFERIQREAAVETLDDQGLGEFVQKWMNTNEDC